MTTTLPPESLVCVDCKAPLPGALAVASHDGAGSAWCCAACSAKYPRFDALRDRLAFVATERRNAL